jgi:hypothetical protein
MTTTVPSIVPTGYAGDYTDFLRTKADRSGAVRAIDGSVSIPSGTASGTLVGLFPFNKGFSAHGMRLYCAPLDTGTSQLVDIGYTYYDSATGSSIPGAFISSSTAAQSGGASVAFTGASSVSGMVFNAAGDGWVTLRIAAQSTLATGTVTFNWAIYYDTSGVTN